MTNLNLTTYCHEPTAIARSIRRARRKSVVVILEVWPESHWPGFALSPSRRIPVLCGMIVSGSPLRKRRLGENQLLAVATSCTSCTAPAVVALRERPPAGRRHERRASLAADGARDLDREQPPHLRISGAGPGLRPQAIRDQPPPQAQNRMALGVKGGGMLGQWYTLSPTPPVGEMPKTRLTRSEAPPTPSRG